MRTLDQGQEKIKKICDTLRNETLQPAKAQADKIIEDAKAKADHIVKEGKAQSEKMISDAQLAIEQERNVFYSSLAQAEKQSIDSLKLAIENKIFNEGLQKLLSNHMGKTDVVARLINTIVSSIEKDGISKDFSAIIPQSISAEEVNAALISDVLEQLNQAPLPIGDFNGGIQLKLEDKKFTLDVTDKALGDFLKTFVRKDFRKFVFKSATAHG